MFYALKAQSSSSTYIISNCFGHFITPKFVSLKSKQFSQFFLVRGKSERIEKIHFAESSGLRPERQKKKLNENGNNVFSSSLAKDICVVEDKLKPTTLP
jgi:hypothetical protein